MAEKKQPMMRADEATVQLLDKLLQKFTQVSEDTKQNLELLKQHTPEGIIDPRNVVATTTPQTIIPPTEKLWYSIAIINDGASDCYIIVNTEKSSTTPSLIKVNEAYEVDLGVPKIMDAQVWCTTGSASLRVRGVR